MSKRKTKAKAPAKRTRAKLLQEVIAANSDASCDCGKARGVLELLIGFLECLPPSEKRLPNVMNLTLENALYAAVALIEQAEETLAPQEVRS